MTKADRWKSLLGGGKKPSVQVRVGDRLEALTTTQAHRFDELSRSQERPQKAADANPFEQQQYSLADAAFRLMTSESEILEAAAAGSMPLFADVGGLRGHWRREIAANDTVDSPQLTLRSGCLALPADACRELQTRGHALLTTFDYPRLAEPAATGLEAEVLAVLSTWRGSVIRFVASEPRQVTAETVVLLAPLARPGAG